MTQRVEPHRSCRSYKSVVKSGDAPDEMEDSQVPLEVPFVTHRLPLHLACCVDHEVGLTRITYFVFLVLDIRLPEAQL